MGEILLVAEGVSHQFTSANGEVQALRDVSLRVREGEFVALVGPSGCGKTTLLRMFAGLLKPEGGRVLYQGKELNSPPPSVGMVFQKPALLPWRSVVDNVRLPLQVANEPHDMELVHASLERVGLTGFENALPAELSGGMQQRVALARALISHPTLLLMDEPFGALDSLLRDEMNYLLLDLWQQMQPTVVFVTHDIQEAVFLADRVVVMSPRPGRIIGNYPAELPRPRSMADQYGARMHGYVEKIWQAIRGRQGRPYRFSADQERDMLEETEPSTGEQAQ